MSRIGNITVKDTSNQYKYSINDTILYTPYQLYESQNIFIQNVLSSLKNRSNILIQSPTGTGKTMSLLCSTISWALEQQEKTKKPPPQIIFASRTHSQLKQVVKQLHKLCYKIKIALLSSRDHSCISQDLRMLRGKDKQLQCRLKVTQRKGQNCPFYKGQQFYLKQAELGKQMDLQETILKGKIEGFCPYYYQKYSASAANLILLPYQYLFDKKLWQDEANSLQNSILILDEAHNIQQVCEQYRQHTITFYHLSRAMQHIESLRLLKLNENKGKMDPVSDTNKNMLKVTIEDIEINASYIQAIYENFQALDISPNQKGRIYSSQGFLALLDQVTQKSQFGKYSNNVSQLIQGFQRFRTDISFFPYWSLESWMEFIEKVEEIRKENSKISPFKVQLVYEGSDLKIIIHCLDPANGFHEVLTNHKPRSIILTSGTLSPLKVWPFELNTPFEKKVSCPHIISPKQTQTVVLGNAASGAPINTSYENRKNMNLFQDIGQCLLQICKNTPYGVVAFFPSYTFLEQTKYFLASQTTMTRLYSYKSIFFQNRDSKDFTTILERYMKEAQSYKGALLCALIRGKISQGLDFSDNKCRAVVLVGVPYPSVVDVKVESKMDYLDRLKSAGQPRISGKQWLLAETIRAVNQGIGRLIRNPQDYGTVYLLDTRFMKPDILQLLPSWAKENLINTSTFEEFVDQIKKINKVKDLHPDLIRIQQDLGLVSTIGMKLQQKVFPALTSRQSISKPISNPKQQGKIQSLQEMIIRMKDDKQEKQNLKETKAQSQKFQEELLQKMEKEKDNYQRRIFGKKAKPIGQPVEAALGECPICQQQTSMIKSNTCHHSLCKACWDKWLEVDLRCPICRGRVRKNFLIPTQK